MFSFFPLLLFLDSPRQSKRARKEIKNTRTKRRDGVPGRMKSAADPKRSSAPEGVSARDGRRATDLFVTVRTKGMAVLWKVVAQLHSKAVCSRRPSWPAVSPVRIQELMLAVEAKCPLRAGSNATKHYKATSTQLGLPVANRSSLP